MRFVSDAQARLLLPPVELFALCVEAMQEKTFLQGVAVAAVGEHRPSIKAGFLADGTHGARLRPHSEGAYWTLVFDRDDRLRGCVEAVYLSYFRTAAQLLAWPQAMGHQSVLVCGTGRLGSACVELASLVLPGAAVHHWSPSGRPPRGESKPWYVGDALPEAVITATSSMSALEIPLWEAKYIGVGGGRVEIGPDLGDGPVVHFVEGGGGLDVLLAAAVLNRNEGEV